jgi:hypothetical protein
MADPQANDLDLALARGAEVRQLRDAIQLRDQHEASVYSALIRLAAEMARGDSLPSDFDEDHPRGMRRAYWLKQCERGRNTAKDWAMRVRQQADALSALDVPGSTK